MLHQLLSRAPRFSAIALTGLLAGTALSGLIGCAGTGVPTGVSQVQRTAASMDQLSHLLAESKVKVEKVLELAEGISSSGNRVLALQAFNAQISDLEVTADAVRAQSNAMRQRGAEYFSGWAEVSQELSSPALQQRTQQQKNEIQKGFTDIRAATIETRNHFEAFMAHLYDVQSVLAYNLSDSSLETVQEDVGEAKAEGEKLKASIDKSIEAIKKVRELLGPGADAIVN